MSSGEGILKSVKIWPWVCNFLLIGTQCSSLDSTIARISPNSHYSLPFENICFLFADYQSYRNGPAACNDFHVDVVIKVITSTAILITLITSMQYHCILLREFCAWIAIFRNLRYVCVCVACSPHDLGVVRRSDNGVFADDDDRHVCHSVLLPQLVSEWVSEWGKESTYWR